MNPRRVRSPNPGYCFKAAGWKQTGVTARGLIVLEKVPRLSVGYNADIGPLDAQATPMLPDVQQALLDHASIGRWSRGWFPEMTLSEGHDSPGEPMS